MQICLYLLPCHIPARIHKILIITHEYAVLLGMGPRPNTFRYAELRTATENFSATKKLGEGGFGSVYKVK